MKYCCLRGLILFSALVLFACGGDEAVDTSSTTTQHRTSITTIAPSSTATTPPATTTTLREGRYSVALLGRVPALALGDSQALGSGCDPDSALLPDGVWFGWIEDAGMSAIEFDLACLWPGRIEPAAGNENSRLRTVPTGSGTLVYAAEGEPIAYDDWLDDAAIANMDNAPGLADTAPFWLFVNRGKITEMAAYPDAIRWAIAGAWPEGMSPGCCDMGDVIPASPDDAWPETGWPADGFYYVETERSPDSLNLLISRFRSCRDHAGECPEWWVGDEVFVDPDLPALERTVALDEDLKVVIEAVGVPGQLVGNGSSYARLWADIDAAAETWLEDGAEEYGWIEGRAEDPSFPFGYPTGDEGWPYMYRGPGGSYLTYYEPGWWTVLEIDNGHPVLYFHAGLIAG